MRRILKTTLITIIAIILLLAIAVWLVLRASLPQLDGELSVTGLQTEAVIQRDSNGVVTIETPSRRSAAYATGFAHAQDRYFQMDLARRYAAGELAALFGQRALDFDRTQRRHQMRKRSQQASASIQGVYRDVLQSYVEGVNAGLRSLDARPFEYQLLRAQPEAWSLEDSALVLASMYFRLQASDARDERELGWLAECLPPPVFDFIAPVGTDWDAPLQGGAWPQPPLPTPQQWNIRDLPPLDVDDSALAMLPDAVRDIGSNNWALAGTRTANGAALVADDMHLGMSVPHIWYRLRLLSTALDGSPLDITGLSLPGTPFVVVGSNTHVAWGFTNSYGDWLDLIRIETDPDNPAHYLTPQGSEAFRIETETINVKGGEHVAIEVRHTRWGPVIEQNAEDEASDTPLFAWRWIAHSAAFFTPPVMLPMEHATSIHDAIELAPLVSIPAQNLVVGDRQGNIGWTIMGRIPLRHNSGVSRLPQDWRTADEDWPGWLPAAQYPVIINPPSGQLWTANNRQLDGRGLSILGYGQVGLGARAGQIRDGLSALTQPATERDMQTVQLDNRALFLARWRQLLLDTLDEQSRADNPLRQALYQHVEHDSERAAPDSVGYRLVREFRQRVINHLMASLTRQCPASSRAFDGTRQAEGPVWQLLNSRPMHLLDAAYADWQALLLAQIDTLTADATRNGETDLAHYTWGEFNRLSMRHPLAGAIPLLGNRLNMPATPMAGDNEMPRVQRSGFGQSQRMAVSPGFEADGYMSLPGGQSGHPLSPFYRSLHADWLNAEATPFLPGEARHTLILKPR